MWPPPEEGAEPMTRSDKVKTAIVVSIMVLLAAVWLFGPNIF